MALLSCPSCKRMVSSEATTCPKCGHPLDKEWAEKGLGEKRREKKSIRIFWAFFALGLIWWVWPDGSSGTSQFRSNPAVKMIGKHLTGFLSISSRDLEIKPNPLGQGQFVYVAQTRFSGVERLIVWFANGTLATNLNGATKNATPDLPFPRHAPKELWLGTGLDANTATKTGLKIVFGR